MKVSNLLKSLSILNFSDCIFTVLFVVYHDAIELNPLMRAVIVYNPWLFIAIKTLFSLAIWNFGFIYKGKNDPLKWSLYLMLVIYGLLNINHLIALGFLAYSF